MSDDIVLVVTPTGHSARGQLFEGHVDGRRITHGTTTPLLAAARALLMEGVDPKTRLVMTMRGEKTPSAMASVGVAAKLTVKDNKSGAPRFAKWEPQEGRW
jgi:hypothetical protein